MALKLYNTLTRQKAEFQPIDPNNVRMYVCGPTVYDYAHIGNARPVIVFDVLFRLLRHIYGEQHITYVRNITDVDDKINARAARDFPDLPLNEAIRKVTTATEKQFHDDIAALGVLPPTYEPRATEYIHNVDAPTDMARLIEALVKRGHAYVAEDHVLFDVGSMPDYGKLSNRSLDEMEAGARVEVAPYKKGPMDFVLWKPSKPGEPAWPSPCGIATPGRPGWHIECSAMSGALLGDIFDIHGGGIDLTFPHHENEIAQSRCAHGTPVMANVWMHNGFLQVEGEKMSKSLGNFVTINELERAWVGRILKFNMLKTHYRQPINWTQNSLHESRQEIADWVTDILVHQAQSDVIGRRAEGSSSQPSPGLLIALEDDLNSPAALAHLRSLAAMSSADREAAVQLLEDCEFLGILQPDKLSSFKDDVEGSASPELLSKHFANVLLLRAAISNGVDEERQRLIRIIEQDGVRVELQPSGLVQLNQGKGGNNSDVSSLISARLEARKRKDFAESDRIRDELAKMGIALKDTKNKETGEIETTWEVMR